ncbi:copper amine oxidase N-terminal domain-containing protein [Paenibacillus woosongensis]|uniref:Copper amine oxidase N-terminal domain-containing protein n=1 Tax=Paenibacillus woosongensis TaxID=307580 RepID=A0AA95L2Y9_9BACL|nr:copper amine oxidase N-terminal domain-containing protein [Paenibacillus woosongensis]WHX51416.1 copper amine oxidase N-terminal domain-containing protein [Paenibacillus woosongensis]
MSKWLALPLVLMLVFLTGCQAVGGFDVNKALQKSLEVQSSESRQKVSVEVVPADNVSAEDKEIIDLINSISLTVDHAIIKDASTMSLKGSVGFSGEKLPYHISMDATSMAIQVEGAQQPLYISLEDSSDYLDLEQYNEQVQEFGVKAAGFLLKHMPNPSTISVKKVQEKVNEETLSLTHLHAEIRGDELVKLAKPLLTNVAKDEAGLKEQIGAFYDAMYPILSAQLGTDAFDEEPATSKEFAVAAMYGVVKEALEEILKDYDQQAAALFEESPELSTVLGKDTVLKTDLYFDGDLNTRKQNMELTVAIPQGEGVPVKAVKVSSEAEMWNIGGTVAVDQVDLSAGKLDLADEEITPGQILRNFEPGSIIYKLLKDEMQITSKYVLIGYPGDYYEVIKKNGTSFVPLRYMSAELDAEIKWNKETKTITIIDDITQAEIVLTVGSSQAKVAGQAAVLSEPAFIHTDGKTYVPLRFISEALGAKVHVDEDGWITVTRD